MSNDKKSSESKAGVVAGFERSDECPCGTGRSYGQCCGKWHAGLRGANAEEVMRSRYTAFVLQDAPYLLATWHLSRRPSRISFHANQTWLTLTVIETRLTGLDSAEVEFIARSRIGESKPISHRERSRFVREGGTWFYLDGH